jgi:hypothetical protein
MRSPLSGESPKDIFRGASSDLLAALLFFAFAFLALILFLFDRSETILLWPLSACLFTAAWYGLDFLASTTSTMTALQQSLLGILLGGMLYGLWLVTWWAYLGLQRFRWIRNAIAIWLIAALILELPLMARLYGANVRPVVFPLLSPTFNIALGTSILLLLIIVFLGVAASNAGHLAGPSGHLLPQLSPASSRLAAAAYLSLLVPCWNPRGPASDRRMLYVGVLLLRPPASFPQLAAAATGHGGRCTPGPGRAAALDSGGAPPHSRVPH